MSDTNTTTVKHTPGPWIATMRRDRPSGLSGDTGVERWSVGTDLGADGRYPPGVTGSIVMHGRLGEANARLIAAAPDLLAACDAAAQTIEQLIPEPSARGVADVVLFQLRAALAKATATEGTQ